MTEIKSNFCFDDRAATEIKICLSELGGSEIIRAWICVFLILWVMPHKL